MHVEVGHLVADDDNVAFAYTLTGTGSPFGPRRDRQENRVQACRSIAFADDLLVEAVGQLRRARHHGPARSGLADHRGRAPVTAARHPRLT